MWWSYHEQKADEHDPSGDLRAILKAAKEHPEKWSDLRRELRCFLELEVTPQPMRAPALPTLEMDLGATMRPRRGQGAFAPYSDRLTL